MAGSAESSTGSVSAPSAAPARWYVVHTYSGYEAKVKASLDERRRAETARKKADLAALEAKPDPTDRDLAQIADLKRALEQLASEVVRGDAVEVLDDPPRQRSRGGDALEALPEMGVPVEREALSRLDQEVDDLGELHVEQRRQLRARRDERVEIERGRREVGPEVPGAVEHLAPFDQGSPDEKGRRRGRRAHARPRTYASMLPAHVILSPPGSSE